MQEPGLNSLGSIARTASEQAVSAPPPRSAAVDRKTAADPEAAAEPGSWPCGAKQHRSEGQRARATGHEHDGPAPEHRVPPGAPRDRHA